jgi:hypothetical protein
MFRDIAKLQFSEILQLPNKKSSWCAYNEGTESYGFAWLLRCISFRHDDECEILKKILISCGVKGIDVDLLSEKANECWDLTREPGHDAYALRKDQIQKITGAIGKIKLEAFFLCFPENPNSQQGTNVS